MSAHRDTRPVDDLAEVVADHCEALAAMIAERCAIAWDQGYAAGRAATINELFR